MTDAPQEIEAAFLVCADSPLTVTDAVWNAELIGGYGLAGGKEQQIRDISFDTPARALGRRGYVLRVRRLPSGDLLTLKGESQASDWGGVQRLEIEGAASVSTLNEIGAALSRAGISLAAGSLPETRDGFALLRAWGLHVLHDRETYRRTRNLLSPDGVFGELALDRVRAWVGPRTIEFHEIELEAKGMQNVPALRVVMAALQAQFAGSLVRWHYGKTATIFALMRLAQRGELDAAVDAGGLLTNAGCKHLKRVLEAGGT